MFYEILNQEQKKILPLLKNFKKDFYLAGGTGLALQIGHRQSIDFDFFSKESFSTTDLFQKVKKAFADYPIKKIQEAKDTLTVFVNNKVKITFLAYPYKLLGRLIGEKYFKIALVLDIGCMKLSAVVGRATNKDYADLYFIIKDIPLNELLMAAGKKFPELDVNLALKSLTYFVDIQDEPIKFKNNTEISWSKIKNSLLKSVKSLMR